MKKYSEPTVDVILLGMSDVIITSGENENNGDNEKEFNP